MILARSLSKADFGLVSIFAMTITLLELTSRMSLGSQIVQSPNGNREDFQKTTHAILALAGFTSAILVIASAIPLSVAFGVPSASWAFALLSAVPFLKGFQHLDNYRQHRTFNFKPGVLSELIPQIIVTLAAWPLVHWLQDYRSILCIVITKAGLTVLLTHKFAKRNYRWSLKREFVGTILRFSWPLLLNGLLLFLSQQADQFLIGTFLSLEAAAVYAAAFSFAALPYFLLAPIQSNLFLPVLSNCQDDLKAFNEGYRNCLETSALVAIFAVSPIVSLGEYIVTFFYGLKYQNTGEIVAMLGCACAFRCFRIAPAIASISKADTINQLLSNLVRCLSIPILLVTVSFTNNLTVIAACSLAAEIAATIYSIIRLKKRYNIAFRYSIKPLTILLTGLGLSTFSSTLENFSLGASITTTFLILIIEVALARALFPEAFLIIKTIIYNKANLTRTISK